MGMVEIDMELFVEVSGLIVVDIRGWKQPELLTVELIWHSNQALNWNLHRHRHTVRLLKFEREAKYVKSFKGLAKLILLIAFALLLSTYCFKKSPINQLNLLTINHWSDCFDSLANCFIWSQTFSHVARFKWKHQSSLSIYSISGLLSSYSFEILE
jgi:hypothetical protein